MKNFPKPAAQQRRIVAELDALQAKVDTQKCLQAETAAELDALLPALLPSSLGYDGTGDFAFEGESQQPDPNPLWKH